MRGGRRVAVVLEPGEDLFGGIAQVCRDLDVRQAYVPVFLGAFSTAELIGTCGPVPDPDLPMTDVVHLDNTEGSGSGSIAWEEATGRVSVHLHASLGLKSRSATAHAGHLLAARVQYVVELVLEEVVAPGLLRVPHPGARGIPALAFASPPPGTA
nr:PPC domain-containing DNA-binding protein [Kineococcus siccus]